MSLTLYFSPASPPARSTLLTVKALGLKNVNYKQVNLSKKEHYQPEFLKLNPQHTVPTLVEEDGFTLWDSHAINTYLISKYDEKSTLYPKDLKKRAVVDQRLHFSSCTLFPIIITVIRKLFMNQINKIPQEIIDSVKEAYGFLEKFLENGKYVAGNQLTVADFSIATEVTSILFCKPSPDEFPQITAWIKRMKQLPYFDEINEKGLYLMDAILKSNLK